VSLLEPSEFVLGAEFRLDEIQNFLVGTRFLAAELIAGEGEDLEPLRIVCIVEFGELDIVGIR